MPDLIKKLSTRAREALANTTLVALSSAEVLRVFKAFRKVEEARLKMAHKAGGGGVDVCEARSDMIDALLKHLWIEMLLRDEAAGAVYENKTAMEQMIESSTLNWSLVRPGMLTNASTDAPARVQVDYTPGMKVGAVSRMAVARFMVEQAEHPTCQKRKPALSAR